MVGNMLTAMDERGLGFGFSFLNRRPASTSARARSRTRRRDTYGTAFLVGLLNTLFVSVLGIILATLLGHRRRRRAPLAELAPAAASPPATSS